MTENIAAVSESVEDEPNSSIPRRARNVGLSYRICSTLDLAHGEKFGC